MDDHRKGHMVLLAALKKLHDRHVPLTAVFVGDGVLRTTLEQATRDLGLAELVTFAGRLPAGPAIRKQLDNADLFILASTAEGLPRVAIEAMARGLPVVGTQLGGFYELLPSEVLVPKGDPEALADCLLDLYGDLDRLSDYSARNLARSFDYAESVLSARREEFYRVVKIQYDNWRKEHK